MATTTVIIADDNAKVCQAWHRLLRTISNVVVTAEAGDGEEPVHLAVEHQPSVVLMDVSMPRLDGFEAPWRCTIAARFPTRFGHASSSRSAPAVTTRAAATDLGLGCSSLKPSHVPMAVA